MSTTALDEKGEPAVGGIDIDESIKPGDMIVLYYVCDGIHTAWVIGELKGFSDKYIHLYNDSVLMANGDRITGRESGEFITSKTLIRRIRKLNDRRDKIKIYNNYKWW